MKSGRESVQDRVRKNGQIYGNKSANLIELDLLSKEMKSDLIRIQIPEIFPLDDNTSKAHLDKHTPEWRDIWSQFVNVQGKNKVLTDDAKFILKVLSDLIIATFRANPVSDDIINAIHLPADTLFMVRSTGEEDTVDMANPGGNKSVAAVKLDKQSISKAMGVVIASYVSEKSLTQRLLSGDDISKPSFMPVLIQRMIGEKLDGKVEKDIVISGVMYAYEDEARIDAAPGHGELIVNSKAPFDTYDVTPAGLVHAEIYQKEERLVPTELESGKRKLIFKASPKQFQNQSSLTPQIAKEIALIGEHIAAHYGMAMDIEFVYHPDQKILYLVQARPIPQDIHHKITPSAIAPEQWAAVKKDDAVEKIKSHVVKAAGNAVQVITNANQVIHKNQIDEALKYYLKNPEVQGRTRAVIIKHDAPSTSHEAAFFNALGIPVLQASIKKIKPWLKGKDPVIIVDPQHQYLVNWSKKIKNAAEAELELKNEKVIVDGLFVSSMSACETLLPVNYELSEAIKKSLAVYFWHHETIEKKNIFSQLLSCMDQLEEIKPADANESAFAALKKMAEIFKLIGTSSQAKQIATPHKGLFQHAMLAIAEIHHHLSVYSALSMDSDKRIPTQERLLDAVAKLKALVVNPGKAGLYSDSIFQIASLNKSAKGMDDHVSGEQREYLQEFMKLNVLALNGKTKSSWMQFAKLCSETNHHRQLLARIIKISAQYHFESELINSLFAKLAGDKIDVKPILASLFEEVSQCEIEFKQYHISQNQRLIAAWENKIDDWSDPARFENLFADYEREIVTLSQQLSIEAAMQPLTKKVLVKQVQRLTEMMDKTIKSLKGSPEYAGQPDLVVNRFVQLLNPYHALMQKWITAIPDAKFAEWKSGDRSNPSYGKNIREHVLTTIASSFESRSKLVGVKQLEASQLLSVDSATISSAANFNRQFVEKADNITLEDLFSLMHQNILVCTSTLANNDDITIDRMPERLQPLLENLKDHTRNVNLISTKHVHPVLSLEYNIPLSNHSAKFTLNYNTKTQALTIDWRFFGRNWNQRMEAIAKAMSLESAMLNASLNFEPVYDHDTLDLQCVWKFTDAEINVFTQKFNDIIKDYCDMTSSRTHQFEDAFAGVLSRYLGMNGRKNTTLQPAVVARIKQDLSAVAQSSKKYLFNKVPNIITMIDPDSIPDISPADIYDAVERMDADTIQLFLSKYGSKININYCPYGETDSLFSQMAKYLDAKALTMFLDEYKPDLTKTPSLMNNVLSAEIPDKELIKKLLQNGLKVTKLSLPSALKCIADPELMSWLGCYFENMNYVEFTLWLHDEFDNIQAGQYEGLLDLLVKYQANIDFDVKNKNNKISTLDLFVMLMPLTAATFKRLQEVVPPASIDFAIHKKLLKHITEGEGYLDYFNSLINAGKNLNDCDDFSILPLLTTPEGKAAVDNMFQKMSTKKISRMIFATLARVTEKSSALLLTLIKELKDRVDPGYRPGRSEHSSIRYLIHMCPAADMIEYLKECKPDLSNASDAIAGALRQEPISVELVKSLLDCGAPVDEVDGYYLRFAAVDPAVMTMIGSAALKSMDSEKFKKWFVIAMADYIYCNKSKEELKILTSMLEIFKSHIDLNYRETSRGVTLLEVLLRHPEINDNPGYLNYIEGLLAGQGIDFSVHTKIAESVNNAKGCLLEFLLRHGRHFDDLNLYRFHNICETEQGRANVIALLDQLSPQRLTQLLYENLEYFPLMNFTPSLLERYKNVIEWELHLESNSTTFLERVFREKNHATAAIDYLKRKRPDLSKYVNLLYEALQIKPCDPELIQVLIDLGAHYEDIAFAVLVNACRSSPALLPSVISLMKKRDKSELTRWLYESMSGQSGSTVYDSYFDVLEGLQSSIDIDYSVNGKSLLELLLSSTCTASNSRGYLNFLSRAKIDISKHPKLLDAISTHGGKPEHKIELFKTVIKTAANLQNTEKFNAIPFIMDLTCRDDLIKLLDAFTPEQRHYAFSFIMPPEDDFAKVHIEWMERYPELIKDNRMDSSHYPILMRLLNCRTIEDSDPLIPFLQKHKPDVSTQDGILAAAIGNGGNPGLIKVLLDCGASLNPYALEALSMHVDDGELGKLLMANYSSMSKQQFTKLLYQNLDSKTQGVADEKLLTLLEKFRDQIDLNYSENGGETLLEAITDNLTGSEKNDTRLTALLQDQAIDISVHNELLKKISGHSGFNKLITAVANHGINLDAGNPFRYDSWSQSAIPFEVLQRLLEKLSPQNLSLVISNSVVSQPTLAMHMRVMEQFADVINLESKSSTYKVMMKKLVVNANPFDLAAWLLKHKPDLSTQDDLVKDAMTRGPGTIELTNALIACGAKMKPIHLKDVYDAYHANNGSFEAYADMIAGWDKAKYTAWFYREAKMLPLLWSDISSGFKTAAVEDVLSAFKDKIDWAYHPKGESSLLDFCFDNLTRYSNFLIKDPLINFNAIEETGDLSRIKSTTIAKVLICSLAHMRKEAAKETDDQVLKLVEKYITKIDLNESFEILVRRKKTVFEHLVRHMREQDLMKLVKAHPDVFAKVTGVGLKLNNPKPRTKELFEEVMKARKAAPPMPRPTKKMSDIGLFHLNNRVSGEHNNVQSVREIFEAKFKNNI